VSIVSGAPQTTVSNSKGKPRHDVPRRSEDEFGKCDYPGL